MVLGNATVTGEMSGNRNRIKFERAEVTSETAQGVRIDLSFTHEDCAIRTSAESDPAGQSRLRAAASAALEAVQVASNSRIACSLADLDHVTAFGKDMIAVLVDIEFEGRQVQVFGSCQVSGSEIDSAVKAALNGTNRFFELAMRKDED